MKWLTVCALITAAVTLGSCGTALPRATSKPAITVPPPPPPAQNTALPWPTYGADNARSRAVAAPGLRPPFRRVWTFYGRALLEFPPVVGYGSIFEESFDGRLHAIDPATGKERWLYYSRRCGWSSPTLGDGLVIASFIGDPRCSPLHGGGAIVALSPETGRVEWRHTIGPSESSPLIAGGTVFAADQSGHVYAFAARTGAPRWTYYAGSPIKASPSLAGGRIFIGTYGGAVDALDARTGKLLWTNGGHGNFYSTATVDRDRVFVGSGDFHVYAFSARTGAQLWSFGTEKYVYASPAVWRGLVLIGSYDNHFYAINGETGSLRWAFNAGAAISGAASVVDGCVYFSTLAHKTYALDAASGRLVQQWNDGDYSPAVMGYGRLYLIGLGRIYALAPKSRH